MLGADVFYNSEDFEDIVATAAFLLGRSTVNAVFLTAYHKRSSNRNIHCLLRDWNLRGELLEFDMPLSASGCGDVQLYSVTLNQND